MIRHSYSVSAAADQPMIASELDEASRERVRAALAGELSADDLDADESRVFHVLWSEYMAGPNPERDAFVAKMYADGGYVGEDDQGRLVRTLPGGGIETLHIDSWRNELAAHRLDVGRVLAAAEALVGSDRCRAISWFENALLPDLDGLTPDALVRQGKAQAVIDYIAAVADPEGFGASGH